MSDTYLIEITELEQHGSPVGGDFSGVSWAATLPSGQQIIMNKADFDSLIDKPSVRKRKKASND